MNPITATGTKGFLQWLSTRQPYLYRIVAKKIPAPQLSGLAGDDALVASASSAPTSSSGADLLKNILLGAGQLYLTKTQLDAQKKILDMQLDRARAGLPPLELDPVQYGLPAPSVQLGIDPQTKSLLMWGAGLAGAAFLAYAIFGGGGRRRARARR